MKRETPLTYVLWPKITGTEGELGGKARALAELQQARLPIPEWFVLTPAAFYDSLTVAQRQSIEARDVRSAATMMRGEIRLDAAPLADLAKALETLCPEGEPVAVRSSAGDEDGVEHSFAGQFDSFLFVPGTPDAVAERVAAVWRSAFSQRVLAYREQNGLPDMPHPPSVLIQRMVDADRAGVAFGADPVSGRRGVAVVAAVWGLGTSLVSGESDADTYYVDRGGHILRKEIAVKRTAHCAAPDSPEGVEAVPVPESEATRPVLTDDQVRSIADLVRRAGRQGGNPRDVEWAIEAGKLYLLQSRPITSLVGLPDPDGALNLWDNSNIAESYNGITTPLTFSFARRAYTEVYRQMCHTLGVSKQVIAANDEIFGHMLGLVRGRVYYNLLNWYRLLVLLPGFTSNRVFMEQMMGVREGLPEEMAAEIGRAGSGEKFWDAVRMTGSIGGLLVNYVALPSRIRRFHADLDAALAPPVPSLDTMRPDELAALYRSMERRLLTHWDPPLVNDLFAMIFYGLLGKLTARWCGDIDGTLRNDLVRGKGGMISAEPAQRVQEMAAAVADDPEFAGTLRTGSTAAVLNALDSRPGFASLYYAYLAKFGDRCLEELKLESSTLHDDPTPLHRAVGRLAGGVAKPAAQSSPAALSREMASATGIGANQSQSLAAVADETLPPAAATDQPQSRAILDQAQPSATTGQARSMAALGHAQPPAAPVQPQPESGAVPEVRVPAATTSQAEPPSAALQAEPSATANRPQPQAAAVLGEPLAVADQAQSHATSSNQLRPEAVAHDQAQPRVPANEAQSPTVADREGPTRPGADPRVPADEASIAGADSRLPAGESSISAPDAMQGQPRYALEHTGQGARQSPLPHTDAVDIPELEVGEAAAELTPAANQIPRHGEPTAELTRAVSQTQQHGEQVGDRSPVANLTPQDGELTGDRPPVGNPTPQNPESPGDRTPIGNATSQYKPSVYRPQEQAPSVAPAATTTPSAPPSVDSVPAFQRPLFHWVLGNARNRVRDRENLRFERTRLFGRVRRVFVEIGKRFAADGLLDSPRDVFYLEVEEVLGFIMGTATCTDLRGLAALRKAEYERYRRMEAPDDRFETHGVVYAGNTFHGASDRSPAPPAAEDSDTLKGLACCPGVVRARVRLILDPQGAEIVPGSILAAERTDPGWVMLFPAAAGLLVERGSLLSHSAIVAREMGIPAIVAIPGLTRRIADGDLVEMDGSNGVVRRLPRGSPDGKKPADAK